MKNKVKFISSLGTASLLVLALLTGCTGGNMPNSGSTDGADAEGNGDKKLSLVASFYPMYDFAQKIGGDRVAVTNMVPAGAEPHDWEPSAADLIALEQADVFIYSGAGMEHWVDDVRGSLENKELVVAEASQGIALQEGHHHHHDQEEHDHEEHDREEHDHEDLNHDEHDYDEHGYDPHVWIAPMNAKRQMENIKNALVQADPDHKDDYEANYAAWSAECDKLDQEYREALSNVSNREIVVSHEAFGYLCDAYGLNQLGIQGIEPDTEPDPGRMAEIQDFVKEHNVKIIFSEELVSDKVAQAIADATGAKVSVLSPLEGLSDAQQTAGDDYFSVMRKNLEALKEALQ